MLIDTDSLLNRARSLNSRLREYRRHFHAHPELSFQESETSKFICSILEQLNCTVRPGLAKTGIIAEFGAGPCTVILRADMDALPITEENTADYASKNCGVMHACGHDVHMTCALGAAILLSEQPPKNGRVRLLFQPAEEAVNDDGKGGATLMMEDGAIDDAAAAFALHVWPDLPVGHIGLRPGPLLAGCDSFTITIGGIGAHAARPEQAIDPVVIAAQVIMALQQLVSRRKAALDPALITVGGIRSSSFAANVIPSQVELVGTIRYFNNSTREMMHREIENACKIAQLCGGTYALNFTYDAPALVNDPQLTKLVRQTADDLLGAGAALDVEQSMGAEDFAFMSSRLPGCFFLLGTANAGEKRILHSPTFDIDEEAICIGAAMLAGCGLSYLLQHVGD